MTMFFSRSDRPSRRLVSTSRRPRALRFIAAYKIVKMIACLLLAVGAFHLVRPQVALRFDSWLESLTWAVRHGVVVRAISWLLDLDPRQFRLFGVISLVYAALYALEGVGLWLGKSWAEYLVIVETCLLVPFELRELLHAFSAFKLVVLVANIVVAIYLIHALRAKAPGGSLPGMRGAT